MGIVFLLFIEHTCIHVVQTISDLPKFKRKKEKKKVKFHHTCTELGIENATCLMVLPDKNVTIIRWVARRNLDYHSIKGVWVASAPTAESCLNNFVAHGSRRGSFSHNGSAINLIHRSSNPVNRIIDSEWMARNPQRWTICGRFIRGTYTPPLSKRVNRESIDSVGTTGCVNGAAADTQILFTYTASLILSLIWVKYWQHSVTLWAIFFFKGSFSVGVLHPII